MVLIEGEYLEKALWCDMSWFCMNSIRIDEGEPGMRNVSYLQVSRLSCGRRSLRAQGGFTVFMNEK